MSNNCVGWCTFLHATYIWNTRKILKWIIMYIAKQSLDEEYTGSII